ncbi:MAG TPA: OmpH family outer membrane protein [Chitinophagaceae bacterium]|nr:OmpH family outer membrane protein [Chitinophagaceae bacterium]
MKQLSLVMNLVLLVLVALLFYWHFAPRQKSASADSLTWKDSTILSSSGFKIAYVNLDSLEANYGFFRESNAAFNKKQAAMESDLSRDAHTLQDEEAQLQQKASSLTQAEGESEQKALIIKQQQLQVKEQNMRQELLNEQASFQDELQGRLDAFLAKYNANRKFAYILAYSRGLNNLLYKDSAYDITNDVIAGLNSSTVAGK